MLDLFKRLRALLGNLKKHLSKQVVRKLLTSRCCGVYINTENVDYTNYKKPFKLVSTLM